MALIPLSRLGRIFACCVSDGIPSRSLGAAFVVGTILNLINQSDTLLGQGGLRFVEIVLTYAILYCIAIYGAVSYRLSAGGGMRASRSSRRASADKRDM